MQNDMQQRSLARHQLEMLWFMVGTLKHKGTRVTTNSHMGPMMFGLACLATVTTVSGLAKAT